MFPVRDQSCIEHHQARQEQYPLILLIVKRKGNPLSLSSIWPRAEHDLATYRVIADQQARIS